jgi:hypothetical protein
MEIDIETDKVITTFDSITLAFKSLNRKKGKQWNICQACLGNQQTSYGYKWKYV